MKKFLKLIEEVENKLFLECEDSECKDSDLDLEDPELENSRKC